MGDVSEIGYIPKDISTVLAFLLFFYIATTTTVYFTRILESSSRPMSNLLVHQNWLELDFSVGRRQ